MIWQTTRFSIDLFRPYVMGIVNITPDSFSDGGKYFKSSVDSSEILKHCEQLLKNGADILDIGGESSRPGALPLPLDEELARVLPVVRHAVTLGVPISVDTYKPEVMQAVLDLGADIINDIWAFRQPGAPEVVAQHSTCGLCLMHMHREPQTMQAEPMQGDVVVQVSDFLITQAKNLEALGIARSRMMLDPGIGFGKTVEQNFSLLARQRELLVDEFPLLVGWSRKSSLAAVTQATKVTQVTHALQAANAQPDVADRLVPSVAAALMAVERGACVVRVHDVRETVQALKIWAAVERGSGL